MVCPDARFIRQSPSDSPTSLRSLRDGSGRESWRHVQCSGKSTGRSWASHRSGRRSHRGGNPESTLTDGRIAKTGRRRQQWLFAPLAENTVIEAGASFRLRLIVDQCQRRLGRFGLACSNSRAESVSPLSSHDRCGWAADYNPAKAIRTHATYPRKAGTASKSNGLAPANAAATLVKMSNKRMKATEVNSTALRQASG